MIKIWSVRLASKYQIPDALDYADIDVVANNPTEAIRKAITTQKEIARKEYRGSQYRYAVSVELSMTETVASIFNE